MGSRLAIGVATTLGRGGGRRNVVLALVALAILGLSATAPAARDKPPVPEGRDPGGVAVALIDTGVDYTLPEIAARLARDADGRLVGHDFHDGDDRPYDLAPGDDPARGRRHGTRVAGILLAEAPESRLVPYRYRARDFDSFARAVAAIADGPARIVAMPLGGYGREDWEPFRLAAEAHGELLFVLSAGNDGRDIDAEPVYPPSFAIPNAIVVTSTDAFGRLPRESNWGAASVDVSTPGEGIATVDRGGARVRASGSSVAVPRVAALAARLKARHPDWTAAEIKAAIVGLAGPSPGDRTPRVRHGWIANPALAGE